MIRVDVEQRSPEWFAARCGIPTASRFGDLLTPKTMKLSASSTPYLYELLAEWLTGKPKPQFQNDAMMHGTLTEPEAREYYEMRTGRKVEEIGFAVHDSLQFGASPDGMVGEDGQIEIKCPYQNGHMEVLLTGEVPAKYRAQVQGQLLVTGRAWCDFISYHPEMPGEIIRVERDEALIAAMRDALEGFCIRLKTCKAHLRERGFEPAAEAS